MTGNEKRLIDANELEVKMGGLCDEFGADHLFIDAIVYEIGNAPALDAVEVVHGRWIQSEPGYRLCSHCMADVAIYSGHRNYCPNCGAKMDGDRNA